MAVPTFDELFVPLTTDQLLENSLSVAQDIGLPSTAWQPISIGREVIYINSVIGSSQSQAITPIAQGGLLDWAEDDWLTLLADQVYDVQRVESTAADGEIRLNNSGSSPQTWLPGEVRVLNETAAGGDGATYTNSNGGTAPAGGTVVLEFQADEPGTASNLVSGDVLSLETSYPGVAPVYVEDLIGTDKETDPALRTRCRAANAQASPNGPADAYDFYAKSATFADGSNVGVTRTTLQQGDGSCILYIADADGEMISTDIAQVQETINLNVIPTGYACEVVSIVDKSISIELLATRSNDQTDSDAEIQAAVQNAITGYFSTVNPGGEKGSGFQGIYISTLIDLARDAAGSNWVDVKVTTPAADVALANVEVPVLNGSITWTYA